MKNNIKILVIGIIAVLLLIPSIGAIQTGDSGFMYYVFGDNTVTPVFVFNQSGNDSMLYVDDDGLYVQNHVNSWFRITGNVTGGSIPSYLTSFGHPHIQSLNWSDNVTFLNFKTLAGSVIVNDNSNDVDFIVESDTLGYALGVDGANGYVGIGRASTGNIFEIHRSSVNVWCKFVTDNTDGWAGFVLQNDAEAFYFALNNVDDLVIRDPSESNDCITIEDESYDHQLYLDSTGRTFIRSTTGNIGYELDINGDCEADSFNPVSDLRAKNLIYNLNDIPNKFILKLCRIIDFYIFEWKDPLLPSYEDNETYQEFNSEGYGCGVVSQYLYDDILYNFTDNYNLNYKVANSLVTIGNETQLWNINADYLAMIYHRAWQINDERISILEQEVFG